MKSDDAMTQETRSGQSLATSALTKPMSDASPSDGLGPMCEKAINEAVAARNAEMAAAVRKLREVYQLNPTAVIVLNRVLAALEGPR
jgi:RecA/RadA recombinase